MLCRKMKLQRLRYDYHTVPINKTPLRYYCIGYYMQKQRLPENYSHGTY